MFDDYFESRVIKGIFSLAKKQGASESRPFIILDNISQLYEQILERKVKKKLKDGYIFKDFSEAEIAKVNDVLEKISAPFITITCKWQSGIDKRGKPIFTVYQSKKELISIQYYITDREGDKFKVFEYLIEEIKKQEKEKGDRFIKFTKAVWRVKIILSSLFWWFDGFYGK